MLTSLFDAARKQPDGALIVLDVDETIICAPSHFGSEAWYQERIRAIHAAGTPLREAKIAANDEWEKVHETMAGELADATIPSLLRSWKGPVMGLTARAPGFARRTKEQLSGLGVRFSGVPGLPKLITFDEETAYEDAILYVGPLGDKGRQFARFLGALNSAPKRVFFADDRPEHLQSMKRVLAEHGIEGEVFRVTPRNA